MPKKFNVAIFLDTIAMISVELHTMVLLVEIYLFVPLSLTMTTFQGYSTSSNSNWKCGFIWLSWNFVLLLSTSTYSWIVCITIFYSCMINMVPDLAGASVWHWLFYNCLSKVFQTLHGYKHNHAQGLQIHTRLDNHDLVSRQQKRELQN